jgi:hypothetical protein
LSISDTHKSKRLWPYLAVSLICVIVANVYALFGHGVRSGAMEYMFLYPLIGGFVMKILSAFAVGEYSRGRKRVGVNLYNSGLAALTCGALLRGIVEIAGTDSSYIHWFFVIGWAMIVCGMVGVMWRR